MSTRYLTLAVAECLGNLWHQFKTMISFKTAMIRKGVQSRTDMLWKTVESFSSLASLKLRCREPGCLTGIPLKINGGVYASLNKGMLVPSLTMTN